MSKTFKTPKGTELPLLDLRGKIYLQVAHRLVWFREDHADWGIETEVKAEKDFAIAKSIIRDPAGRIISTATKYENRAGFEDFIEKAETGSVGRALALCGYGTQFTSDLEEGTRLADAPIEKKNETPNTKDPLCWCGVTLIKGKYGYYCINYKDKSKGEHTKMSENDYEIWKQSQNQKNEPPTEDDIPF